MSNDKVIIYKNALRNKPDMVKPYVPQYQVLGVEPEEVKSNMVPANTSIAKPSAYLHPLDNPRMKRPGVRQPYAEQVPSPLGRGKGPVPNVGNNMEFTWAGVDGELVDDFDIDKNHPMIDNNDYVDNSVYSNNVSTPSGATKNVTFISKKAMPQNKKSEESKKEDSNHNNLFLYLKELGDGDYLLLVHDVAICSAPLMEIQEQVSALVFGEHALCNGEPISLDDIMVVKKAKIKTGVFVE